MCSIDCHQLELDACGAANENISNFSLGDLSCEACRPAIREERGTSDSSAISGLLQMHEQFSAMS
jgi:hypothetical protein